MHIQRFGLLTTTLLLMSCGSAESEGSRPPIEVGLTAIEYAFEADESITITEGDTVTFEVRNEGQLDHQLEVLNNQNRSLGLTERIPPGARRSVTVTFEEAGFYRVICDIDDHLTKGQEAGFEVFES